MIPRVSSLARLHSLSSSMRMFPPITTSLPRRRPIHWKASAPFAVAGSETYHAQETLAQLPVPDLDKTLARLKESLKPIAWSPDEFATVQQKIDEFSTGLGPQLQERLVERASEKEHWLEEWWDDLAYLSYRDSVVINVSYFYGFNPHAPNQPQTPVARAASLARAAMVFRQKLKNGTLKPETTKDGPICMDTYRWMFDCCRIPGEGKDWSVSYATEEDTSNTSHIVVFRKNRVWMMPAVHNGIILGTSEFEHQIQYIYDNTPDDIYPGVGVLTASNRDIWAVDYGILSSSGHNAAILDMIQSAAFCMSLDTGKPTSPEDHSRFLWHGETHPHAAIGLQNRWVDKPVQFIVFDNAYAGIMGEHSVMDGTPTARMCDEVLDMLADESFDHGSSSDLIEPTPMDWQTSPHLKEAIKKADEAAIELVDTQSLAFLRTQYGKDVIKKFKVSPDSWAQMVVQLAYSRLLKSQGQKRNGGTYEAATTRRFLKGRTEALRVVTTEGDMWVESMDKTGVSAVEKKALFDQAAKKHVELAKAAGMGHGVDRHILGLKLVLKDGEKVSLFDDPVMKRSSYWALSTSAVFSKWFSVYGWGEVVPDGFGVAYMTGFNDYLQYTVTSRKEMPLDKFMKEIARAAEDLYTLHVDVGGKARL